jgi:hypothetical protein
MDARWKLVYRPAHPEASELFDLASDPRETRDVSAQQSARVLDLERELARRKPWVTAPFAALDPKLAATAHRALAGLGYAGGEEGSQGPTWEWTCPEHRDWRSVERDNCSRCGSAPLLIAR